MTDQAQATRVTPAGWYQDPASAEQVRWWNGLSWTDHTADKPTGAAAARNDAQLSDLSHLEHEFTASAPTATSATKPAVVPAGAARSNATGGAWLLAFMPLFAQVIGLAAAYVYFYVASTPVVAIAAVVLWLLGFLWALSDSRALEARGIHAPNPAWAIVGALIYLILRRREVAGNGPLIAFGAIAVLAIGLPLVAFAAGAFSQVGTALNVQVTLEKNLVQTGQLTSVSCPPVIESSNAGELFTCTGTAPDGSAKNIWVSFDTDSGKFSYAIDIR